MKYVIEKSDELTHHGVKGMRWGVRRSPQQLGHKVVIRKKVKNKTGPSLGTKIKTAVKKRVEVRRQKKEEEQRRIRAKEELKAQQKRIPPKQLSSEELNRRIQRLELEKRYKDLDPTERNIERSKNFVKDTTEQIGRNVIVNLGTQAANKFIGDAINKAFKVKSDDPVNRIVNPNKGQSDKK